MLRPSAAGKIASRGSRKFFARQKPLPDDGTTHPNHTVARACPGERIAPCAAALWLCARALLSGSGAVRRGRLACSLAGGREHRLIAPAATARGSGRIPGNPSLAPVAEADRSANNPTLTLAPEPRPCRDAPADTFVSADSFGRVGCPGLAPRCRPAVCKKGNRSWPKFSGPSTTLTRRPASA